MRLPRSTEAVSLGLLTLAEWARTLPWRKVAKLFGCAGGRYRDRRSGRLRACPPRLGRTHPYGASTNRIRSLLIIYPPQRRNTSVAGGRASACCRQIRNSTGYMAPHHWSRANFRSLKHEARHLEVRGRRDESRGGSSALDVDGSRAVNAADVTAMAGSTGVHPRRQLPYCPFRLVWRAWPRLPVKQYSRNTCSPQESFWPCFPQSPYSSSCRSSSSKSSSAVP